MRRILLLGTVVLAALAAARAEDRAAIPGFFDLAVTGGEGTYEAMGFAPEERGTALSLLARQLFSQGTGSAERAGRRMRALPLSIGLIHLPRWTAAKR